MAIGITPIKCVENTLIWGVLFQQSDESKAEDLTCPLGLTVNLEDNITESFEIRINVIFRCSFSTWGQPAGSCFMRVCIAFGQRTSWASE